MSIKDGEEGVVGEGYGDVGFVGVGGLFLERRVVCVMIWDVCLGKIYRLQTIISPLSVTIHQQNDSSIDNNLCHWP